MKRRLDLESMSLVLGSSYCACREVRKGRKEAYSEAATIAAPVLLAVPIRPQGYLEENRQTLSLGSVLCCLHSENSHPLLLPQRYLYGIDGYFRIRARSTR